MIWYMKSEKLMTLVDGQRKVSSWRGFLNGLCLEEGGSGWGALLIVGRFKELLCRKLEQESLDEGVKHVPASAFVYAIQ